MVLWSRNVKIRYVSAGYNGRSGNEIGGTAREPTGSRSPASSGNSTPGIGKVNAELAVGDVCPPNRILLRGTNDVLMVVDDGIWVAPDQSTKNVSSKKRKSCFN